MVLIDIRIVSFNRIKEHEYIGKNAVYGKKCRLPETG